MTYGSEFIGFNKRHALPLQRVVDIATHWMLGLRRSNRQVAGLTLSLDLGLPLIYEFQAALRARLYAKLNTSLMRTALPQLQKDKASFAPRRTWCTENEYWMNNLRMDPIRPPAGVGLPTSAEGDLVSDEEWTFGVRKWAPWCIVNTDQGIEQLEGLDEAELAASKLEWQIWVANGRTGPGPAHKAAWMFAQDIVGEENAYPMRPWLMMARQFELHRRSNGYVSAEIASIEQLHLGINETGLILVDPTVLTPEMVEALEPEQRAGLSVNQYFAAHWGLQTGWNSHLIRDPAAERLQQESTIVGKNSNPEYDEVRKFMRDVRECALERLLENEGSRINTFTKWYDCYHFGASRDFLRISLTRPHLTEGVRWLVIVRVGGFPRASSRRFTRQTSATTNQPLDCCPLCNAKVKDGWEWAHLALCCPNERVLDVRKRVLQPAIDYLSRPELGEWFYSHPDLVLHGFSDSMLVGGPVPSLYAVAIAIQLAGGSLTDSFEASFFLSFGQGDLIVTRLEKYGYEYLAEFLQHVAPMYWLALGLNEYGDEPVEQMGVVASSQTLSVGTGRAGSLDILDVDEVEVLRQNEAESSNPT